VVLGEDGYLAREAITMLLGRTQEVELLASCEDLDTLRRSIEETQPDVVLTDIRMPPGNQDEGIRLAQELRRTHPQIGVVVLSQYADGVLAGLLFEGGASRRGYLLKERLRDREELVRALKAVAAGGSAVDPLVVEELVALRQDEKHSPLESLTPKEREVLALIAEGKSNAAIADTLVVTKRAVERHVNSIFFKLGLVETADVSRRVRATLVYLASMTE